MHQGLLVAGRYRRSSIAYYSEGQFVSAGNDYGEVEIKDNVAALYFNQETWLIAMGTPATAVPTSIKMLCTNYGYTLGALVGLKAGEEQKDKISFQIIADGFQILLPVAGGWYLVNYTKDV